MVDLFTLNIDAAVRRALIVEMSQKSICMLNNDFLVSQLNNEDDQCRTILALKCAQALSRARIRKLLDEYINQDGKRYYNSIHWLDLGASMPRQVIKAVVKFELENLK